MASRVPNIPAVSTNIVDKSFLEPVFNQGRTVLIPFFSKYGTEEIQNFYGVQEVKYKLGTDSPRRYGQTYKYITGYLGIPNVKIIGKRLCAVNATLSNFLIEDNGFDNATKKFKTPTLASKMSVIDPDATMATDAKNALMFYASGRGRAYNDIFVKFYHDLDMELFYSDEDGVPLYKYNFLKAFIYEKTPNGPKELASDLKFSLLDEDPVTNEIIVNPRTGESLYINDVFTKNNEFIRAKLSEVVSPELTKFIDKKSLDKELKASPTLPQLAPFIKQVKIDGTVSTGFNEKYFEVKLVDGELRTFGRDDLTVAEKAAAVDKLVCPKADGAAGVVSIQVFEEPHTGELRIQNGEKTYAKYADLLADSAADTGSKDELAYCFENGEYYVYNGNPAYFGIDKFTQIKIKYSKYYTGAAAFPAIGSSGYLYIDKTTGKRSIWDRFINAYVELKDNSIADPVVPFLVEGDEGVFELVSDKSGTKMVFETETVDGLAPNAFLFPRFSIFNQLLNPNKDTSEYSGMIRLQNGSDGDIVDAKGMYSRKEAKNLIMSFYTETDALKETLYPRYDFDYVIDTEIDQDISAVISNFTKFITTAMAIVGFPYARKTEDDTKFRERVFYSSNMHMMIYAGQHNTEHYDKTTKKLITMPLSYYALYNHLTIDTTISITEPVANIDKGAMPVSGYKSSYTPSSFEIESLRQRQINSLNIEIDGIYLLTQETGYKRNSKLSRANNVKTLHRIKKDLPRLLKDLLQLKAIVSIMGQATARTEYYMQKWEIRPDNITDGIFEEIQIEPKFDENSNVLFLNVSVDFVGIIEKINIPIIVK